MFPTKRLNPVAGTGCEELADWLKAEGYSFPTKRLNPVAGTFYVNREEVYMES